MPQCPRIGCPYEGPRYTCHVCGDSDAGERTTGVCDGCGNTTTIWRAGYNQNCKCRFCQTCAIQRFYRPTTPIELEFGKLFCREGTITDVFGDLAADYSEEFGFYKGKETPDPNGVIRGIIRCLRCELNYHPDACKCGAYTGRPIECSALTVHPAYLDDDELQRDIAKCREYARNRVEFARTYPDEFERMKVSRDETAAVIEGIRKLKATVPKNDLEERMIIDRIRWMRRTIDAQVETDDCPVCLDDDVIVCVSRECGHALCIKCAMRLGRVYGNELHYACPICRTQGYVVITWPVPADEPRPSTPDARPVSCTAACAKGA